MRFLLLATILTACSGANEGAPSGGSNMLPCVETDDQCPLGTYCLPDGTCGGVGCKQDDECGAGQSCCDHQCSDTTSNSAACGACGHACASGDSCCEGSCKALNTLTDCGACGNTCASGDFCDGTQCNAPTYP